MGGFLARDYLGGFIAGHSSNFVASSPLAAEAVALRDALNWARCLGFENAVFEADNLELINTCRKDIERLEISGFVKDILQIRNEGIARGFTWVPRFGNCVAHLITKLASRGSLPRDWTWNLPPAIVADLERDKAAGQIFNRAPSMRGHSFEPGLTRMATGIG